MTLPAFDIQTLTRLAAYIGCGHRHGIRCHRGRHR